MRLDGKVILIVGGALGIGRAAVQLCAERGAKVIIADINPADGAAAAAESGGEFIPVDVTDENSVKSLMERINQTHGRLDVFITTAGILRGAFTPIDELSVETFRNVLDVNVTGSFLCTKHAVPLLRKSVRGVIILTSSGASTGGSSSYAYGSSKGGVSSLAVTLTNYLQKDNIRVNVLSPGGIDTAMKRSVIAIDAKKRGVEMEKAVADSNLGTPEGVGSILAWLASDEADYVRGTISTR